jgi:hypothetical protein
MPLDFWAACLCKNANWAVSREGSDWPVNRALSLLLTHRALRHDSSARFPFALSRRAADAKDGEVVLLSELLGGGGHPLGGLHADGLRAFETKVLKRQIPPVPARRAFGFCLHVDPTSVCEMLPQLLTNQAMPSKPATL